MGPAAPNLIEASKDAAMLVLGTRGRGGFKGLVMGSVSSSLAAHAQCPVLIHHGEHRRLTTSRCTRGRVPGPSWGGHAGLRRSAVR